ncbi:unnamed protein product [Schistosoma margrebowiei]|uniref:Uncharacterized protein n=1 Tax=Schistosoma margrebowiei TaxID=48269 RepID=A0A183MPD8_9TREM|nr:unnamed protein product [Schistosoma margrebowiei]
MERPDNVGDREDQSNSNGNEEIQFGSTVNQRNSLVPSWTTKARYEEGNTINVIQCYGPTNDSNDDIKKQFFERQQSIIEKCPTKDLTILIGDLNAKVGMDNTGYEDIMRRHGLGERNENGERVANICAFNKLVIGSKVFPHKRIHKAIWISPDHNTENQIDHSCINKKFRRTIGDAKIRRGADIASDHHLVVNSIRADKKKYVEELTTTADKAARKGNMKQLHDTTKKLAGKYSKPERPVKDKEGRPITQIQQQRNRWVEYFEELLNRSAPINPPDIEAAHTNLPIDVNPRTTEEIRMTIRQIKRGKAAGPDNISAETLKLNCDTTNHRRTIR